MPKVNKHRTHRSSARALLPSHYLAPEFPIIQIAILTLIIGLLLAGTLISLRSFISSTFFAKSGYVVNGEPTITVDQINRVLKYYDSPAQGKGQALYDYGKAYGIDPAYALAFFMHESTFGTRGVAVVSHSLGNIRVTGGEPQYQGYRAYRTWEDGFKDWYQLISDLYIQKWNLTTVEEIIPVYAPAEDNNDEGQYIATIKRAVDTWRKGGIAVS